MKLEYETPPPDVHPRPLLAAAVSTIATILLGLTVLSSLPHDDPVLLIVFAACCSVGIGATCVCVRGWWQIRAAAARAAAEEESLKGGPQ